MYVQHACTCTCTCCSPVSFFCVHLCVHIMHIHCHVHVQFYFLLWWYYNLSSWIACGVKPYMRVYMCTTLHIHPCTKLIMSIYMYIVPHMAGYMGGTGCSAVLCLCLVWEGKECWSHKGMGEVNGKRKMVECQFRGQWTNVHVHTCMCCDGGRCPYHNTWFIIKEAGTHPTITNTWWDVSCVLCCDAVCGEVHALGSLLWC